MDDELSRRIARLEADHADLRTFAISGLYHSLDQAYMFAGDDLKPSCLACGKSRPQSRYERRIDTCVFGGGALQRLVCPACDAVFGPLSLIYAPEDMLSADYRMLYAGYAEGDSTEAELRAFEALNPRRDGLYLNWGAGAWSRSIELLRGKGYDVWGYEPNAARDRPFVVTRREEVSAKFDGIFSNNVIEHLTAPAAALEDMISCLKPDGAMAHASPCYAWSYAFTRFHVFFPLGRSVEALAKRIGLRVSGRFDEGELRVRVFSR